MSSNDINVTGGGDTTDPVTTITSPSASSYQNGDFTVYISDSDNVALDYCQYRILESGIQSL